MWEIEPILYFLFTLFHPRYLVQFQFLIVPDLIYCDGLPADLPALPLNPFFTCSIQYFRPALCSLSLPRVSRPFELLTYSTPLPCLPQYTGDILSPLFCPQSLDFKAIWFGFLCLFHHPHSSAFYLVSCLSYAIVVWWEPFIYKTW